MLISETDIVGLEQVRPEANVYADAVGVTIVTQDYCLFTPVAYSTPFLNGLTCCVERNDWRQVEVQSEELALLNLPEFEPRGFRLEQSEPFADLGKRLATSLGMREEWPVPVVGWSQFGDWLSFDEDGVFEAICLTVHAVMKAGPYVRDGDLFAIHAREAGTVVPSHILDELTRTFREAEPGHDSWIDGVANG